MRKSSYHHDLRATPACMKKRMEAKKGGYFRRMEKVLPMIF